MTSHDQLLKKLENPAYHYVLFLVVTVMCTTVLLYYCNTFSLFNFNVYISPWPASSIAVFIFAKKSISIWTVLIGCLKVVSAPTFFPVFILQEKHFEI